MAQWGPVLNSMNEKAPALAVHTGDVMRQRLEAEAPHEAFVFGAVNFAPRKHGSRDALSESIPHVVEKLPYRGRPAYDANMRYQHLGSPDPLVLIHLKPEVVGGVQAMACYEREVIRPA